jgi:hypothetical protein
VEADADLFVAGLDGILAEDPVRGAAEGRS